MTLLIEDADVEKLLSAKDCIEAMEVAFREYNSGVAVSRPRLRYRCASPVEGIDYWTNIHAGAVLKYGIAALRVDSVTQEQKFFEPKEAMKRFPFVHLGKRNWGFIFLFSMETGEPLAIVHDFTLSGIRVGATTAVAVKYLARADAETLGLLGTGKIARRHVEAISQVRPIKKVKVYSPSEQHRRDFCEEMSKTLGIEVQPEKDNRSVVEGADIVSCATNSGVPVFSGEWLAPGQLVMTISNTSVRRFRTEVDEVTFARSDLIVINSKESVLADKQTELLEPIEKGLVSWDKVRELGEILLEPQRGRSGEKELIYFKNNTGMGMQFAAAGAVVYQEAQKRK